MEHLFFFFAILPIIWEACGITEPRKLFAFTERYKNFKGDFDDRPSNQKTYAFLTVGYTVWACLGLFTSQWVFFIVLFILAFIPKRNWVIRWVDSVFSFIILVFAVLNAYHFKLDLTQIF